MTFTQKLDSALWRLGEYSAEANIKPETAVYYAIGDSRSLAAMRRKAASLDEKIDRINRCLDGQSRK